MRVYIGHDQREQEAFEVASDTAAAYGCEVIGVYEDKLRAAGLLTRPVDRRGNMWDLNSNASQSTEFANTRFFVPMLAHDGWCLFTDCDVVFLADPHILAACADPTKAVMVVKHQELNVVGLKMDGQVQQVYPRKNWSSVMLINACHPAHRRLNLMTLNQLPGRDLHAFCWLADEEIGELPAEWNWLVGLQPKPKYPAIAHFTLGGPWLPRWPGAEHDNIWIEAAK